tara:strand:- start:245 stop:661 length:417 start_codon:yes stop_codon:yes gene_type:complete
VLWRFEIAFALSCTALNHLLKNGAIIGPIIGSVLRIPIERAVSLSPINALVAEVNGPVSPSGESKGFNQPIKPVVKNIETASQFSTNKTNPKIRTIKVTTAINVAIGLTKPINPEEPPELEDGVVLLITIFSAILSPN